MVQWQQVHTVLLDMDGTLLDLHYDNHFWLEHVPRRFAERHGLALEDAKAALFDRYRALEGTLDWYCVDFWSRELELDIPALKREIEHLISVHPYVTEFLQAVRGTGKRVVLVTNAHRKVLELKMRYTSLHGFFDVAVSAHDLGSPKEDVQFWHKLQAIEAFDRGTTLLVDDSVPVLRSARAYGIAQLVTVQRPDSKQPLKHAEEFAAIHSFRDILPCAEQSAGERQIGIRP